MLGIASLDNLSNELLLLILSNFDRKNDKQTIAALRNTNKRLHYLADPFIYCTVADQIFQHPSEGKAEAGSLQRRAWKVAQHPELARFVKEIQLKEWDHLGKDRGLPQPETADVLRQEWYAAAMQRVNLPEDLRQAILQKLGEEVSVAHLAFILALCPDLEVLKIRQGFGTIGRLVIRMIQHATGVPRAEIPHPTIDMFKSIRHVALGNFVYETGLPDALSLLSLPSLRILTIYGLADNAHFHDHTIPAPENTYRNTNSLKLELDMCILSGEGLGRLLASCASPHSLTVRWRPGLWNEDLSNEQIGEALRKYGLKLEYLHVDTTDVYNHRYGEVPPSFGSFEKLTNLHTLAVPRFSFSQEYSDAASILPQSWEKLYVLGIEEEEIKKQREPFGDAETRLSELKVVYVPWHHYSFEEWFGEVSHRCVDYSSVEGLALENLDG